MCIHNLLTIAQFGFWTGHSIKFVNIQMGDALTKQLDMGKVPINMYINLSKAFDTLDHSISMNQNEVCALIDVLSTD